MLAPFVVYFGALWISGSKANAFAALGASLLGVIVNVPIGVAAILIGWWKLPRVEGHDVPRPSPFAALLVTCGVGALTFAIVKANDWGWGSPGIVPGFSAAIVPLVMSIRAITSGRR